MTYVKLFSSILTSSLWSESAETRIVWITLLAMADRDGFVASSMPGLVRMAMVTREQLEAALAILSAPDPESGSPDKDGRRIEKVPGGWQVVNYERYRDKESPEDRRERTAERVRRFRERRAAAQRQAATDGTSAPADVTPCNAVKRDVTLVTHSDQAQISTPLPPKGGEAVAPRPRIPEPPPPRERDEASVVFRRLGELGWRSGMRGFRRRILVTDLVRVQGLTLEALDRLWGMAQAEGESPIALLTTWLDPEWARWKHIIDDRDGRAKEARLRAGCGDRDGQIVPIAELLAGVPEKSEATA